MNKKPMIVIAIAIAAGVGASFLGNAPGKSDVTVKSQPKAYVGYPAALDPKCRDGTARMFDECGDQLALFEQALARANAEGKVLLVEFGAEWCVWCHALDAHMNGDYEEIRVAFGKPDEPEKRYHLTLEESKEWIDVEAASALRKFVAMNFVIVHIEMEFAPNSEEVMNITGAAEQYEGHVPFVYTVDSQGGFAAKFDPEGATRRRDDDQRPYRGYDRKVLLDKLTAMRDAARAKT